MVGSSDDIHSDNKRRASCEGKARLTSRRAAIRILQKHRHEMPLCTYHCNYCGYWHIGEPRPMPKKKPEQKKVIDYE